MLEMLAASARVGREPATFSEYVRQQLGRGLLQGPPLRWETQALIPRLIRRMRASEAIRQAAREERGIHVPSVLFLAITGRCNFRCRHCYTQQYEARHMDLALARRIVTQACDLGVSLFVVTGGEPLLHPGFFELPREMPDIAFLVFTNGALVPQFLAERRDCPNLLWLVSLDGPREWNDARRGDGSSAIALGAMDALRARGIPFGFSTTLSVDNVEAATEPAFIESLVARGCRSGFFLEQIPGPPSDPPLGDVITERLARCRRELALPIVGFPADEIRFGGCQAGGNGIAHVSPDGYLEPCPVARLAADSLAEVSLEEAFSNPFLKEFRHLKERFSEGGGESCTYNGHGETFEDALARYGAHPTV